MAISLISVLDFEQSWALTTRHLYTVQREHLLKGSFYLLPEHGGGGGGARTSVC
jgi:hypothetical protein